MRQLLFLLVGQLFIVFPVGAQQKASPLLEVRFQPDSLIYVYENIGPEMPKTLYTGIIQNMAFVNSSNETMHIKKAQITALKDDEIIQLKNIKLSKLESNAAKYSMLQAQGYLELYDFQLQTSQYLYGVSLAENNILKSGQALILTHETFLFEELPDYLLVSVVASSYDGKKVKGEKKIIVVNHKSQNSYSLPLRGTWTTAAGPSLVGHHRWGSLQEFAYDFIKIGSKQKSHTNNGTKLNDYFAFGETVLAIGDGVVVSVLDGIKETSDNLIQPSESPEDYLKRMIPYQNQLLAKGFEYVFGNHIIIRHPNNEYSNYLHLKNGSVLLKVGDTVKKGQPIGQLGHSGNSTEPHLHFHLSNGSDIMYSRSIPIEFENIKLFPADNGKVRHIHSGQIITTNEAE